MEGQLHIGFRSNKCKKKKTRIKVNNIRLYHTLRVQSHRFVIFTSFLTYLDNKRNTLQKLPEVEEFEVLYFP